MATALPLETKEIDDWQGMMFSCRQACKILNQEFSEPEFLNWNVGRRYHRELWGVIRTRSIKA